MIAMETQGPSRRALFRGQLLSKPVPVIGDGCLAEAGIVCCSCGDACPEAAIRFRPRIGLPPQAIVNESVCTGCGDCVAVCPGDAVTLGAAKGGVAS
jgi:ferredoxin-type protein NapF